MNNSVLEEIKRFIIGKLKANYGYCGVAENDEMVMINSDDKAGNDIKIKIELVPE